MRFPCWQFFSSVPRRASSCCSRLSETRYRPGRAVRRHRRGRTTPVVRTSSPHLLLPENWTNHALFQFEYDQTSPYAVSRYLQPGRMSPFYQRLATLPPATLLVIEAPWYYEWINNPYPYYQAAHHQHMHVGFVPDPDRFVEEPAELPLGRALRFHNAVHVGDLEKLRKRRVKYVIFHKRFSEEVPRSLPRDVVDVSCWVERYTAAFGGPVYEDPDIAVFDVMSRKPG